MENTFIYMKIPLDMDFGRLFYNPTNLATARMILALPEDQLKPVAESIAAYQGFLDRGSLEALLAKHLPEGSQAADIADFLIQVDRALAHSRGGVTELLKEIREGSKDQGEAGLTEADFGSLGRRLADLFGDRRGFDRQRKAERLEKSLGSPLSDVQIICDLRPIFSEDRARVEGTIVLTTIKLVAIGTDELPITFEARLTEKQVSTLATRTQEAIQKIAVLKRQAAEMGVAIPVTDPSSQRVNDAVEG